MRKAKKKKTPNVDVTNMPGPYKVGDLIMYNGQVHKVILSR